MGCWSVSGQWTMQGSPSDWGKSDEAESRRDAEAACANGIRVFDTAATYGADFSERLLGGVLHGRRGDCFIVTQFGFVVDEAGKNEKVLARGNIPDTGR